MKLATYQDGSRDGQLVVVSRDLSTAHYATGIASRLQQVLDDWNFLSPQLQDLAITLNHGKARHAFPFEPAKCLSPLPRAYHWASSVAYLQHLQLGHAQRGEPMPEALLGEPLLAPAASDQFLAPCAEQRFASVAGGLDFEAGLAVMTGDLAAGASSAQGLDAVRLLLLSTSWCRREVSPTSPASAGLLQGRPMTAFGPVAVTPDELGEAWQGGKVSATLQVSWNGRKIGQCDTGSDMSFHFGQLIAQLSRQRPLGAGCLVGSGPVSNQDAAKGVACLADKRAQEMQAHGEPRTAYAEYGDTLYVDLKGRDGLSVFGAIEHSVTEAE
ncbi:MAG TPA: fumarylacetoacetate hydrolase family protein [Ideonella sp.]|uniref:fumarylacetoacetate hydrolase family protein n=1 Tax=Ideonella sp. TaxID=1929293 RepID=UPI002C5C91B3|nr:fumarylacetoacetate hydrolase family protein [Ideonella sp.]HSI46740.1 fumarylacetoacetate hydrolase family protein [Ideonella sp.]